MRPASVQKLKENVPELRELIAFLATTAAKLDSLALLKDTPTADLSTKFYGSIYAKQIIDEMLAPLLDNAESTGGADPSEYVV